ncbi:hypothetical protein CLAIMM_02482, partial [Cladophialophora immunda]
RRLAPLLGRHISRSKPADRATKSKSCESPKVWPSNTLLEHGKVTFGSTVGNKVDQKLVLGQKANKFHTRGQSSALGSHFDLLSAPHTHTHTHAHTHTHTQSKFAPLAH